MASINPTPTTVNDLRVTLDRWEVAHRAYQQTDEQWRLLDADLKGCKSHAATEAAGDATLKNAEARAAYVQTYLATNCAELVQWETGAATDRRNAAADLERLTERIKTLRVIQHHETAELEAQTAKQQAEAFARLPF